MGGSTQLWAQGVLLLLTGLFLLAAPPRRPPGLPALCIAAALAGIALCAFLPAAWFASPAWRTTLTAEFHATLPATRSPQPWLSGEAFLLFLTALVWAVYLQCHPWTQGGRQAAILVYVAGITALAAAAAGSHFTGHAIPWWSGPPSARGAAWLHSSFFPNRNQTANVLALAGILAYAGALDSLRNKRYGALPFLLGCLAVLCVELVVVYSRAGILLFFGGIGVWQLWSFYLTRSAERAALAAGGVALALACFLLAGGETLGRFQNDNLRTLLHGDDFRVLVHRDALGMAKAAPALGAGLGNFKALFPQYQLWSVQDHVILHPESDWLWVAVELGWGAVALLALGIGLWLWKCFPFDAGSSRFLRSAATVCAVLFVLHGLEDVSAHRLGALWPALFLASIAVRAPQGHAEPGRGSRIFTGLLFRGFGLILACAGGWFLASNAGWKTPPTSADVTRYREEAASLIAQRRYREAAAASTEAIRIAPIDWTLYFQRAGAEAQASVADHDALRDFAASRFLEPHWPRLCLQEGQLWFAAGQQGYALNAWAEALRRARDVRSTSNVTTIAGLFHDMLAMAPNTSPLRGELRVLSRQNADCLLLFLAQSDPTEFDIESLRLLHDDPKLETLTEEQRRMFFRYWYSNGDRYALLDFFHDHPDFRPVGWKWLAETYASFDRYQEACETVLHYGQAPPMPVAAASRSLTELQQAFFVDPGDVQAGVALCGEQEKEGQFQAALFTLRSIKTASPPPYFSYMEGDLLGKGGQWKQAWAAFARYLTPGA